MTKFCTLVTVHILVQKCVIGLCMTSDNMTLANFLFGPLRVDITTFLTNSIKSNTLMNEKGNEQDRGGSYWVFGHAGIHKQDQNKRKFWIIKALTNLFSKYAKKRSDQQL